MRSKTYVPAVFVVIIFAVSFQVLACADECGRIESADRFAKARCRIEELMDEKYIASFQVAVAKDGEIIHEEAFGFANEENFGQGENYVLPQYVELTRLHDN